MLQLRDWANPFHWAQQGAHASDWLNNNNPSRVKTAADYFQGQGWSRAQAVGLVANLLKESNLNPRAVGDSGMPMGSGNGTQIVRRHSEIGRVTAFASPRWPNSWPS